MVVFYCLMIGHSITYAWTGNFMPPIMIIFFQILHASTQYTTVYLDWFIYLQIKWVN